MAMEVSLMEGGIVRLQSPALGVGIGVGSLWRWGVLLLLAAAATYGSLIARLRLLARAVRRSRGKSAIQPQAPHVFSDGDGDDDDSWSSCSSEGDGEEERSVSSSEDPEEEEPAARVGYFGDLGEYGGGCFGSYDMGWLSVLAAQGREIVNAWKGEESISDRCSRAGPFWDLDRGEIVRSFAANGSPISAPAVVMSAGDSTKGGGGLEVRVWDARSSGIMPAASADFSLRPRRRVLRLGGCGKLLYVGDGAGSSAAVDLRKVRSPVGSVEEDNVTWWDADAVVIGGDDLAAGFRREISRSATAYRLSPRRK